MPHIIVDVNGIPSSIYYCMHNIEKHQENYLDVIVPYDEHRWGGDRLDPDDKWSSREDETVEFTLLKPYGVSHSDDGEYGFWFERFVLPGFTVMTPPHKIFVVVVRYSDGDTFGTTTGLGKIVNVVASVEEAREIVANIENGTIKGPWEGYFASVEDIQIYSFGLNEETPGHPSWEHLGII